MTEGASPCRLRPRPRRIACRPTAGELPLAATSVAEFLVTGDRNTFFCGAYQSLETAYIDPRPVFQRVQPDRFVGRAWLLDDLDAFLRKEARGYYVVEAKAGMGKTAFLAHLVRQRAWVHHFVELAPGASGVARGLRNLASQVIRTFELDGDAAGRMLPDDAAHADFLATLLWNAAAKLAPGEKIVLVVDGLDEAGTPAGGNVLGLPNGLPNGVFIVCSHRPVRVQLHVEPPRGIGRILPGDEHNLADVQAFLRTVATSDRMRALLGASGQRENNFVEALVAKSGGVWVYLHYVLSQLEAGDRSLDLDALPEGLANYYADFWHRFKDEHEDSWYQHDLPLLTALAASQAPLTLDVLAQFAGLAGPEPPTTLRQWKPFLDVQPGEPDRYRLYHKSLEDFLHGRVHGDDLLEAEQDFVDELGAATKLAHQRIADRYLAAWGGLEPGLPRLGEGPSRDLDERYGLRHLIQHLLIARPRDARAVFCLERASELGSTNVWFAALTRSATSPPT